MTARANKILGIPVRIKEISSRLVPQAIRGGATINIGCTTGFTVRQKYGATRGVLSAAHCEGYWLTYSDGNGPGALLQTMATSWNAIEDVQWFKPRGIGLFPPPVESKFYGVSSTLPTQVTGFVTQAGTDVGRRVCHRGITSGFSCGTVTSTSFNPSDPPHYYVCGSPTLDPVACAATWISVGPLQDPESIAPDLECAGGDSGGPWFSGGQAMGIHTAGPEYGTCELAVYMSIDRISSLGVELLYPLTE